MHLIQLMMNKVKVYPKLYYPVGMILESYCNINPSEYCIGEWELTSKGMVTVGYDPSDKDFNQVKKTGGSKFLQKHSHDLNFEGGNTQLVSTAYSGAWGWQATDNYAVGEGGIILYNKTKETGTGDSGNMPPHVVVYKWTRVR